MSGAQGAEVGPSGLTLPTRSGRRRPQDLRRQPAAAHRRRGRTAGELVVLREVTERVRDRERLQQVLDDRSRVAAALQASMVPRRLPDLPGTRAREPVPARRATAARSAATSSTSSPSDAGTWAFVLGDVSGKGAEAAAVSAAARYTLRALAGTGSATCCDAA